MSETLTLTWPDLLIDDLSPTEARRWLDEWHGSVSGRLAPLALSRFGSWFLLREDGRVDMLDVLEGEISTIARSQAEFYELANSPTWQEDNLLSRVVYELHKAGARAQGHQCYLFAPHPRLGGQNPWAPGPPLSWP